MWMPFWMITWMMKTRRKTDNLNFYLRRNSLHFKYKYTSSHRSSEETNLTSIHEDVGSIPGLAQWVKDLVLLWLWHRLEATALIRPLAWEPPYAVGTALEKAKRHTHTNSNKKKSRSRCFFTGKSYQTFREELTPIFLKLVQKMQRKEQYQAHSIRQPLCWYKTKDTTTK